MRFPLHLIAVLLMFTPAIASETSLQEKAIALSEGAIGNMLPPLEFRGSDGSHVSLADLRGKPLLISLVFTGCTDVCPMIVQNLRLALDVAQSALGADSFNTITIGFDTKNDTPERMRSFARTQGADLPNWLFLSGDQRVVQELSDAIGFSFYPSAGGFDHMAQVSVVDADGRIYQQIMGGVFNPPTIVEPLKDLMFDQRKPFTSIAGLVERIKLFCTVYNPNTGRYYFNYSLFIGAAIGILCLALVMIWLLREFSRSGKYRDGAHS